MTISLAGFGHHIGSHDLAPGDLMLVSRGAYVWLAMRVAYESSPFDLVLTQLRGDMIAGVEFPRIVAVKSGDYTTIEGPLIARPRGFALPADDGTLVIDCNGEAFIRKFVEGVEHFSLHTGLEGRPAGGRTYYADWELIQVVGEAEHVIASFVAAPVA